MWWGTKPFQKRAVGPSPAFLTHLFFGGVTCISSWVCTAGESGGAELPICTSDFWHPGQCSEVGKPKQLIKQLIWVEEQGWGGNLPFPRSLVLYPCFQEGWAQAAPRQGKCRNLCAANWRWKEPVLQAGLQGKGPNFSPCSCAGLFISC